MRIVFLMMILAFLSNSIIVNADFFEYVSSTDYNCSNNWYWEDGSNCSKLHDYNQSTWGIVGSDGDTATSYYNITKRINASNAYLYSRDGAGGVGVQIHNVSLPDDCFNQSIIKIFLSNWYDNPPDYSITKYYCYNGTDYELLLDIGYDPGHGDVIYDTYMGFNETPSSAVPNASKIIWWQNSPGGIPFVNNTIVKWPVVDTLNIHSTCIGNGPKYNYTTRMYYENGTYAGGFTSYDIAPNQTIEYGVSTGNLLSLGLFPNDNACFKISCNDTLTNAEQIKCFNLSNDEPEFLLLSTSQNITSSSFLIHWSCLDNESEVTNVHVYNNDTWIQDTTGNSYNIPLTIGLNKISVSCSDSYFTTENQSFYLERSYSNDEQSGFFISSFAVIGIGMIIAWSYFRMFKGRRGS